MRVYAYVDNLVHKKTDLALNFYRFAIKTVLLLNQTE